MQRLALAVSLAVCISALAPSASATERAPERDCRCEPEPGARLHDGFFVRAEAGLALLRSAVRAPSRDGVRGIGQSSSVSVGGTPWRGLVVGGSIWAARIDPTFIEAGRARSPDDDSVKLTLARVGPFLSLYPAPTRGFHADLALGVLLAVESDEKGDPLEPGFAGPVLALGLGHEWFVGDEVSVGVSARATFSRVSRETAGGGERLLSESLELVLGYTYH